MSMQRRMVKGGIVAVSGVVLAAMMGCGLLEPTDADKVDITLKTTTFNVTASATSSQTLELEGSIDANRDTVTLTVSAIQNANGNTVGSNVISVNIKQPPAGKGKFDIGAGKEAQVTFTIMANAPASTYTCTFSATAGSATSSKTITIIVTGGGQTGTPVTTIELGPIGSNQAAAGSSVDLDAGKVYTMAEAAANVAQLDLCYSYSGADGTDKLFTPSHAKASGYNYAANWTNPPTTQIIKTNLSGQAAFDGITTVEEINALWTGTPYTTSVACAVNDIFVVKTTQNALVLVLIKTQTPGASGTITIKVAK